MGVRLVRRAGCTWALGYASLMDQPGSEAFTGPDQSSWPPLP